MPAVLHVSIWRPAVCPVVRNYARKRPPDKGNSRSPDPALSPETAIVVTFIWWWALQASLLLISLEPNKWPAAIYAWDVKFLCIKNVGGNTSSNTSKPRHRCKQEADENSVLLHASSNTSKPKHRCKQQTDENSVLLHARSTVNL